MQILKNFIAVFFEKKKNGRERTLKKLEIFFLIETLEDTSGKDEKSAKSAEEPIHGNITCLHVSNQMPTATHFGINQ